MSNYRMPDDHRAALETELDGLAPPLRIDVEGHRILLVLSGSHGFHTGRKRYCVVCLSCDVLVHGETTGPACNVEHHVRESAKP